MRLSNIVIACSSALFLGCNSAQPPVVKIKENIPVTSKLSAAGTQGLMSVVTYYYNLKNALVGSNAAKTDSATRSLLGITDSFLISKDVDSLNKSVFQPYMDTIIMQSKAILEIKDPTCEKQRLAFSAISNAIYTVLKKSGMKNAGVYQQYCPMAFNEKGAYWLSNENEIKNPYFGKKMLECGEVKDSL